MNRQGDRAWVEDNEHGSVAHDNGHSDNGHSDNGHSENGHSENGASDNGSSAPGPNWNSWIHGDDPTVHPNPAAAQVGVDDVWSVDETSDRRVDVGRRLPAGRVRATWSQGRLNTPITATDFEPSGPGSSPDGNGNRSASVVPIVSVPISSGHIARALVPAAPPLASPPPAPLATSSTGLAPSPPLLTTPIEPAVESRNDVESNGSESALSVSQPSFSQPAPPLLPFGSGDVPVGSLDRRDSLVGPRATISVPDVLGYLFLACIIVVTAIAGAFLISGQRTPVYGARAEIRYPLDADQSTGFLREDRQLSTQVLLLTSRSMLAPIARESTVPFDQLEDKISASVVSESEIIHLEAKDEDPDVALGLVLKISERYLAQVTLDVSSDRRNYLETQIGLIGTRLDEIVIDKRTIVQGIDPTKVASDALLSALTAEELQLLQRRNTLESEIDALVLDNLQVGRPALMSSPFVLEDPVSPKPMQDAAIGLAIGLLLATGAVFIVRVWTLNRRTQG